MLIYGAGPDQAVERVLDAGQFSGPAVADLRPNGGVGYRIRVTPSAEAVEAQLRPAFYWPKQLGKKSRQRLIADGWVDDDQWVSITVSTFDALERLVPLISRAISALGTDPEDVLLTLGDEPSWLPNCAHAITFWDWKSPVPFDEFTNACSLLLASGADSIHFNESETGADHYGLVISGCELAAEVVDAAWELFWWEVPDDGAEMAVVDYTQGEGYRVLSPRASR